ncbi:MAG TPA: hypothetical protein DDW76_21630 [Cyanobacteria bacterium UBA11369]|nr:hypothetical protein [Cyanobacteria bacterium UBA11371]HBE33287.1 hypothetical protein [Cyanobacteria bacterium UBA11368]HBE51302.1 hypothetical protein [Cyanobacteria bacterium UBA11369]
MGAVKEMTNRLGKKTVATLASPGWLGLVRLLTFLPLRTSFGLDNCPRSLYYFNALAPLVLF